MQFVTSFVWQDNDIWDLAETFRPVLAARPKKLVRHDCQWMLEDSAAGPAPTLAKAARSLAAMDLDGAREPRVWIVPFDNKLFVANLTGSYGPAIASIEGMEDISVQTVAVSTWAARRSVRD